MQPRKIIKVIYSYLLLITESIKSLYQYSPEPPTLHLSQILTPSGLYTSIIWPLSTFQLSYTTPFFLLYAPGMLAIYSVPQTLQACSCLDCSSSNANISLHNTFCLTTQSKVDTWALAYSHQLIFFFFFAVYVYLLICYSPLHINYKRARTMPCPRLYSQGLKQCLAQKQHFSSAEKCTHFQEQFSSQYPTLKCLVNIFQDIYI